MTLLALPDKWAVKIESEAEAVELQGYFTELYLTPNAIDLYKGGKTSYNLY